MSSPPFANPKDSSTGSTPTIAPSAFAFRIAPILRHLKRQGPFLIIFGFVVALLYRLTLYGEALYWGDIFLYFLPLEEYVQTSLRAGEIPLWNRFVLCGQPLVGNPQSWVIYPTTAILPFVPVWTFLTINHVLHLALAGIGTYLFTRRLCGDRLSGVLAALTFAGSGFVMARLQFPTMIQAIAYLPWLLTLADRLIERPGTGYASLLALVVALEILAGHAQIAYMSFGIAILYFLSRLYHARRHPLRVRRAFALGALALIVGFIATGAQLLPMLELFGLSTRERLTWEQANRFTLRWEHLVHFLAPYWHGNPARGDFWGRGNLWESCVYIGIVPLGLAVYAFCRRIHRRAVVFFSLLAVFSLWLALGKFAGLFWVAFYVVPGLASFHDPARFTYLTTFALAVLAGYGLRALRDRGWSDRFRMGIVVAAAVNLWAFSAHINPTLDPAPDSFVYRPRMMAYAPRMGEGRVYTAERQRTWDRFLNYSDYGPESARYAHELTDTASPNIGMRFNVEEAGGYEPVPVKAVTEIDALTRRAIERKSANLPALMGLTNTTAILLPEMTRYQYDGLTSLPARGATFLAVREPLPRAFLVRETRRVDGDRRALAVLSAPEFDPRQTAIVSGSAGLVNGSESEPVKPAIIERQTRSTVRLDVDAGSSPAFLVLSETWFPGWRASLDGQPVVVERTNHAFRGVAIPPGKHRVEMSYRPAAFQVGLYLTLAALFVTSAGLAYGIALRPAIRRSRGIPASKV